MNMEEWNELYPPGTAVIWTPDGGVPIETKTTRKATQPARLAMVRIEGWPQPVFLHRLSPAVEAVTYRNKLQAMASEVAKPTRDSLDQDLQHDLEMSIRAALRTAFRWGAEASRANPPE